jgi:hypothetical protein
VVVSEELYLAQLVHSFGEKSWTQIAAKMGNRSDVQCRYHYKQMQKDRSAQKLASVRKAQSAVVSIVPLTPPQGKDMRQQRHVRQSNSVPSLPRKEGDKKPRQGGKVESVFELFERVAESEKDMKGDMWY